MPRLSTRSSPATYASTGTSSRWSAGRKTTNFDVSKEAYAAGIRNLVRGLQAWRNSKSGKRKGPKVRFPRFKKKGRSGTARILSATVKLHGGRWHVSFSCEVDRKIPTHARPGTVVGVDVGIKHLAVLSTGRESGTGVAGDPRPQGWNGRGADRKTPLAGQVAVKRPPRQGTVDRQRPTADRVLAKAH